MKKSKYVLTKDHLDNLTKGRTVVIKANGVEVSLIPQDSLLDTLDRAEEIVSKWPSWKRNALGTLHLPKRR